MREGHTAAFATCGNDRKFVVQVVVLGEGRGPFMAHLAQLLIVSANAGIGLGFTNTRSSELIAARTQAAVTSCKAFKVTHMLWLDDDMVFPSDALMRLLEHDKPVVGCDYAKRDGTGRTIGTSLSGGPVAPADGIEQVSALGFGCLLVKRHVFDELAFPWFSHVWQHSPDAAATKGVPDESHWRTVPEDGWFCRRCKDAGIPIYVDHDLSRQVGHYGGVAYWTDGQATPL